MEETMDKPLKIILEGCDKSVIIFNVVALKRRFYETKSKRRLC